MKEKKNEILVGRNKFGYFVHITDNHHYLRYTNKKELYTFNLFNGGLKTGNYYDVLNKLLEFEELYSKRIKLIFCRKPNIKIPKEEKSTIEKLVKRLEKDAKENKDLKFSLKKISNEINEINLF